MSDIGIGKIQEQGPQVRDAIHVAVMLVKSYGDLSPGQHVGFADEYLGKDIPYVKQTDTPIGIIDPFLNEDTIGFGTVVWLFLYPGSITSLRHQWLHPSVDGKYPESKAFIEQAAQTIGISSNTLMEEAAEYVADPQGMESHYMGDNEGYQDVNWKEFWRHFGILTGKDTSQVKGHFFSCSC